jgi:hypothetical protein
VQKCGSAAVAALSLSADNYRAADLHPVVDVMRNPDFTDLTNSLPVSDLALLQAVAQPWYPRFESCRCCVAIELVSIGK